jgi:CRP-like cAMP-binding protein
MADVNPKLLRRMLALRQFPMFATAELAELATIAENLVPTRYPAGAVVAPAGARLSGLHLVLEGRIEASRSWGPRQIFGALEVLARRDHRAPALAAVETATLQLSEADLVEVLEDNFGVLLAVVRELAARTIAAGLPARPIAVPDGSAGLGLVERLIVLRQLPPFAGARLQGLAMLAHGSEEIDWAQGAIVARAGELASGSLLVLGGVLQSRGSDGATRELGRGHAFGALETLAGTGHTATLEALTPVRALYSSGTAMLDVLEDHPDIGMSMITAFARGLLDHAPGARTPDADRGN